MRHFVVLAALLTAGCGDLLSLHELYTAADKVFDAAIEGRWENKDDRLVVERAGDGYEVTFQSKMPASEPVKYEVRLVDIRGVRFADLLPDGLGHMFLKVRVMEGQLRLAFFETEWLRQRIPHEEASMMGGKKQAVLTASTARLRALVGQYATEPKAFGDEIAFQRMK